MKRLAWCLIYGFAGLAQAAINDVTFHGTLVSPPACTISDGKTIEVEFRNVIIDNINGDNFRQDVPYTITCDPDVRDDAWEMSLTWTGSQTPYDDSAIETDVSGLGINLKPRRELLVLWKSALPLGCVVAPRHPLAQRETVSFQEATAYPVALQSKALTIRRYLEAQYNWLFKEPRRFTETNSLQLVKQLALGGTHVLFTSELDVAPELASRQLVFIPVRDKGAEPQEISVAMDATKPPGAIVKLVSERLIAAVQDALAAARGQELGVD